MLVYDEENPATSKPAGAFDDLIPSKKSQPGAFDDLVPGKSGRLVYDEPATGIPLAGGHLVFDEEPTKPTVNQKRTWLQAAGDTAIDAAKGVVGLGESVVGLTDLVTGNLSGEGWSGIGFDPARTRRILSELYSDPRQQANRNVSDAKGFIDTTKAMVQNPSAAVGSMVESAPLMVGGAAAVRTVATKMLAAQGLAAGSAEAAAFLARPDVLARLTAIGSAAEGALTAGNIQEQGRQAGRSYSDTAPAAVAGGAITGLVGFGTSKIPGFKDSEVGAAIAGMGGTQRQSVLAAGKEVAKGMFKEGVLEELPQSAQEQVWTNLALGKPWDEGVAEAAAQGMVAGAGMGGGMNTYSAGRNALARTAPVPGRAGEPVASAENSAHITASDVSEQKAPIAPVNSAQAATNSVANETAPVARPEIRLAELELLSEHRSLTDQEKAETTSLARALHDDSGSKPQIEDGIDQPKTRPVSTQFSNLSDQGLLKTQETPTQFEDVPELDGPKLDDQGVRNLTHTPTDGHASSLTNAPVSAIDAFLGVTNGDSSTSTTPPAPGIELQNRDRSRAASVVQMADIAKNPDYMRLGPSRSPDTGAPMVFAVGDDIAQIQPSSFGHKDTAVMSDGQRVAFTYAVVPAYQVYASNFSDGNANPKYDSKEPGTIKALNNGRTASIQASYLQGKADKYKAELIQDAQNHGVSPDVINRTVNPMLVRLYMDSSNTPGMGAKSQGQGLGMAPGELARQDAPLMDATVLTAYRSGDVGSAGNRDFVRAFIGKLRQNGQDIAGLMTAEGALSPLGRTRIQAALVQAAYGDADLVNEMFDSQDSEIKTIGTALKTVAGHWADMRDSARMGAIDPQTDITGNLMQAIHMIRKSRQDRVALTDLVNQPDLLTGAAPDPITVGLLRFFFRGEKYLSLPLGSEKVIAKLNAYVQAAMGTSSGAGMFDDAVTVDRILESITSKNGDSYGNNEAKDLLSGTDSGSDSGLNPDQGRSERPGSSGSESGQEPGSAGEVARELTNAPGIQEGNAGPAASQERAGQRSKRNSAQVAGKIEDAGQKIGGARKDRWKERGLDLSDLDTMSESEGAELATKANVWKPDYAGMVQSGTRADTAAFIKVVYDSLAAKPKKNTPDGRRQYVTMMQHVRSLYTELAQLDSVGNKVPRRAMLDAAELLKVRLGLRDQDPAAVKAGKELLFSVYKGRSDPFVVSVNEEMRARKLVADGFPNAAEPWKSRLIVSEYGGSGYTARGVELIVKEAEALGTPVTAEQAKGGVYRVVTKAGKALAYLSTRADAEAAAKTIYAGKLKAAASDKPEPTRPHLDVLKRDNLPQRIDRDVTADDFVKDFGFRGVEFGNWAAQDERQRILNMAYDGLRDLAEIMGLPPKALSLNGSLGMAFGARGGGKFAAHYEPGKLVINMTKLQGGGSMAHEWAHALDHYLGELDRPDAYTTAARGASGWYTEAQYKGVPVKRMEQVGKEWKSVEKLRLDNLRPELAKAFDQVMSALFSGQETKAQMVRGLELQLERTQALAGKETDSQTKAMYERMATSQEQNLAEARQEPDDKTFPKGRSSYAANAQKLSGKSASGYWSRPTEMFARAFESWVFDKVVAMGAQSDYLVHGVEADRFAGGNYKGNPYPEGTERATISAAFDHLAKSFKTRTGETGNVALYQASDEAYHGDHDQPGKPDDGPDAARNIGMLNGGVARAPGGAGADSVLPYVGRVVPGNAQLSTIAAAFGDNIQGFGLREDLTPEQRRKFGFFNGAYLKGVIFLRDMGQDRPHLAILGHEMAHRMKATQPELYPKLVKAIEPYIDRKRYDTEFRKSSVAKNVTTDAGIHEEFIGEVLSDGFMDKKFWRAIGNSNPSLLSKVRDFIAGLIDTIKAKLGHSKRTERILTDFDRVMELAGEVMGEYGAKRTAAASGPSTESPAFNRANDAVGSPFKRWFGNSKVVDSDGQPLVVYHGTTRDFSEFKSGKGIEHVNDNPQKALGFFFTSNLEYVNGYLAHPEIAGEFADDARIMPVYLSLQNPKVYPMTKIQDIEETWNLAKGKKLRAELESKGHDGIIFKGDRGSEYVVFTSNQVKSSIGNNGDYAADNPDIRFNRNSLGDDPVPPIAGLSANAWTVLKNRVMKLTSPESLDKLIYEFQDKHIDLKRIRDHIAELGGTVTDLNDAYRGEELFHKRLAKRTEDFLADELKPLLQQMKADGITLPEFERFLHARHAPEANKALAERNPNRAFLDKVKSKAQADVNKLERQLQHAKAQGTSTKALEASLLEARAESAKWHGAQAFQGSEDKRLALSGMSDDEAAAHMAGLTTGQREKLGDLAAKVDQINAKTLDLLEKYGLMDRASLSAWRSEYEFYVPLHRDEANADSASHPTGSGFSVKGNASKQRTGSNEKVTHILGHIAMQREAALTRGEKNNVAKKLYLLAAQNPDAELWTLDKPPMVKTIDQSTGIVRKGIDPLYKTRANVLMVRIAGKDVAIVFNEDNAQAMRMVGAMKNLDVGDLHVVLGLASKGTRWFASVNTQYNPIFGLINFGRDFQEGLINLSTTPLQGKQLEVAKGVAAAMRAVYREGRGKGAANAENQAWIDLWNDLQNTGGTTGYRDLYADAADRVKALEKELTALDRGEVSKAAHAVVDWLSHYNEAMENSVRLSAYKVALDSGLSKERAASLAKNLTVNFNRKGRQTREIGALYAFFNAAIQGTTRMAETVRGPLGQRIMLGGVAIGAINTLVGMALMGGGDGQDDEWAKIPDFIKERSLVIPLSRTDYLTIPMPLGFKLFPNIGRVAMEFAFGGPTKTATKSVGSLLSALLDAFNPLGGAQNLGQMVAPTVIDPVVALMQNKDWTGRPIYRENNNPLSPQPGTKMVKDSASTPGRMLAEAINTVTGGTKYRPGAWSPTPDQIDYVFGQLTGGLGRELLKANQAVSAQFTGDELPAYKIPLVGRLYGNTDGPAAESGQFYENVKALNEIENELKGRMRHGENADQYRKSEPLSGLIGMGNQSEDQISRIRNQRRYLVQQAAPGYQERVKELDKHIGEVMANLNREVDRAQRKEAKP